MNEEERIISHIKELIDHHCYCEWDESEGSFAYEIYSDYRDTVDEETVSKWCKAGNAYEAFWEQLMNGMNTPPISMRRTSFLLSESIGIMKKGIMTITRNLSNRGFVSISSSGTRRIIF